MVVASVATLLAMLAYAPSLRPLALQHARAAAPALQFDLGKTMSKMGGNVMEKMGMGNPMDLGLSEEDAKSMEERLRSGEMSFDDFLVQVKVMQKGASMQAMLGKLGGGGMTKEQLDEGTKKMNRYSKFVEAMDAEERADAKLLIEETMAAKNQGSKAPRLERIAQSAGTSVEQVGQFVMEFNMMRGAAVKFANGESAESIQQSMAAEQQQQTGAKPNRQQRRLAAKKGGKKRAPAKGGFGR